jgi:hypothetical protein
VPLGTRSGGGGFLSGYAASLLADDDDERRRYKVTKYVVLSGRAKDNGSVPSWKVESTIEADDAKRAIRNHIGSMRGTVQEGEQWVAIPESSWKPVVPTVQTSIVLSAPAAQEEVTE